MIQSRKLKIAGAALAAVSILGIVGCGSSGKAGSKTAAAKEDNTEMHIAYTPGLCDAPIMIGLEKGFFKAEGINAKVSKVDGTHISEALGSGKVDGVQTLVSKVVQPLENGLPIKLTAGLHKGCVRILSKKDSGINGVPDLKGKKIGVAGLARIGAGLAGIGGSVRSLVFAGELTLAFTEAFAALGAGGKGHGQPAGEAGGYHAVDAVGQDHRRQRDNQPPEQSIRVRRGHRGFSMKTRAKPSCSARCVST